MGPKVPQLRGRVGKTALLNGTVAAATAGGLQTSRLIEARGRLRIAQDMFTSMAADRP